MPTAFAPTGLHRITVDEYERIIRAGALNDPDRVELVDGHMVDKMGKSAEHGYTTKKTIKAFEALLPPDWTWRSEQPVRIPDYDEPEPDVTVVRGTDEDYEHRIPGPEHVGLLVEISLGTLDRDRNEKLPAYARGGIGVYWIVNLVDRQVEVYTVARSCFLRFTRRLQAGSGRTRPARRSVARPDRCRCNPALAAIRGQRGLDGSSDIAAPSRSGFSLTSAQLRCSTTAGYSLTRTAVDPRPPEMNHRHDERVEQIWNEPR